MCMTKQTSLPVEKGYPERLHVTDTNVSWEVEVPAYSPPIHPDMQTLIPRLEAAGVDSLSRLSDLDRLATLSNRQASEEYGDEIVSLRNPLGRTGINGSGIYYVAGESVTADCAVIRMGKYGHELALVYNRGKWRIPGGFADNETEKHDRRSLVIREVYEEINIDLTEQAEANLIHTLLPAHVKENSRRSCDLGYLSNQVEVVLLSDQACSTDMKAGDDAEAAAWQTSAGILDLKRKGLISKDHFMYMTKALEWAERQQQHQRD